MSLLKRSVTTIACTVLAGLLASAAPARADSIYVETATGASVTADELTSVSELVRTSINEVSTHRVVGDASQADLILRPKLMRLGDSLILTLTKLRGSEQIFSSQLKAQRMDEIDKVALRVTRSVLEGQRASSDTRVGEVTDEEASEGTQRRPARYAIQYSFGGTSLQNLNVSGIGYGFGASYGWDVNRARLKFLFEGAISQEAFLFSGGLGGCYFLSNSDIAPYLSADVGGGLSKTDEGDVLSGETRLGFVAGVGAGLELLRTTSVNVDLSFRAGFQFRENKYGTPEAYSLRLGIYY